MKKYFVTLIGISFCTICHVFGANNYKITDLGSLGGPYDSALYYAGGINDGGEVVGWMSYYNAGSYYRGFLYSDGKMSDIGTLGGGETTACSINNAGQITGASRSPQNGYWHAFVKSGGIMTDIGLLPNVQWGESGGNAINNKGQVVGYSTSVVWYDHAFLYTDGAISELDEIDSCSGANGINDKGQVVGSAKNSDYFFHAFLYSDGVITNLDTLGGHGSCANAINNNGQIVGYYNTEDNLSHAFLYSDGVMTDLGTSGGSWSMANVINDLGQVVVLCGYDDGTHRYFIYDNGIMTDINTLLPPDSGWIISGISGINNYGQICGYGGNPQGQSRSFLLSPIPEPTTILLLALGGMLLRNKY